MRKGKKKLESSSAPAVSAAPRTPQLKKPVILVKEPEDASFADTVRAFRAPRIVAPADIASVTGVRRTRDGHVLVVLRKTAEVVATATNLSKKIAEGLGDRAAAVKAISHMTEVEVVDLDTAATHEEVLAALVRAAMDSGASPEAAADIEVTGLWSTRISQRVAAVVVPAFVASKLAKVAVG